MTALRVSEALLCIFILLLYPVSASYGTFFNPPASGPQRDYSGNELYYVGDKIQANWSTSIVNTTLFLFQEHTTAIGLCFMRLNDTKSFEWIVSTTMGLITFDLTPNATTPGNVFYFSVSDASGDSKGNFMSHYFNISADPRPATSSPSSGGDSGNSTTSPASSSSLSTTSSDGLSTGAQAGIGVAVGLIGLSIIGAFVWFVFRRRSRRRRANSRTGPQELPPAVAKMRMEMDGAPEEGQYVWGQGQARKWGSYGPVKMAAELSGTQRVEEAPAGEWHAELLGQGVAGAGGGMAGTGAGRVEGR